MLSSYRPGGFEARVLDERIPLAHGVIGQETQGPGGFFMALRAVHVCAASSTTWPTAPRAQVFNYTNPVNILAQAVTMHTDVESASFCEGPIIYTAGDRGAAGPRPAELDTRSAGLNHDSWSVRHLRGEDAIR